MRKWSHSHANHCGSPPPRKTTAVASHDDTFRKEKKQPFWHFPLTSADSKRQRRRRKIIAVSVTAAVGPPDHGGRAFSADRSCGRRAHDRRGEPRLHTWTSWSPERGMCRGEGRRRSPDDRVSVLRQMPRATTPRSTSENSRVPKRPVFDAVAAGRCNVATVTRAVSARQTCRCSWTAAPVLTSISTFDWPTARSCPRWGPWRWPVERSTAHRSWS